MIIERKELRRLREEETKKMADRIKRQMLNKNLIIIERERRVNSNLSCFKTQEILVQNMK